MTKYKYEPKYYQPPSSSATTTLNNTLKNNKNLGLLIPVGIAVFGLGMGYFYTKKWQNDKLKPKEEKPKALEVAKTPELSVYQKAILPKWTSLLSEPLEHTAKESDISSKFDSLAPSYDSEIGMDETVMGLNLLRRYLIKTHASGDVVEFSLGTGRNMKYYNPSSFSLFGGSQEISSFTGIEKSGPMLDKAIENEGTKELFRNFILNKKPVNLYQMDAHDTSKLEAEKYDTVVDTFGICSYTDPIKALKEMKRVCKPSGKILLLEHGKGTFNFLNNHLDKHADHHADKWGCRWNREILDLVKESGLEIEYYSRWHFWYNLLYYC
ncbi:S-adenosyl-L-methionine-dependent methyltransferase [Conidiobolus coronatus NRRL 28638]|uniref:S-adenosyl-L-methionine-dependent methyltransferase n=1 Tax=Conidiobolus coronatus (strain ATCC 28846 / CBS 209.66 / NRRL 28638) TaxID=796925 RepID=A0A137PD84_CONC2|nr:S-adenosyl-L-methionine-dependent methyltransferase [Conidiobolus coronatus NRRL 28638]|eukprot:KXN72950.1 S-adenosyl-L-methionine-dependent methyltransferase [Conidiobolus coronatus NRRL 28638]